MTVCSLGYLPFARALVSSFAQYHPNFPALVILADWDGTGDVEVCGATPVPANRLGIPRFPWLTLKYSAFELCCAIKPFAIREAFVTTGADKILYLDSDIWLFAPLRELLKALDVHDFVVTPHVLAPQPRPDRFWERPSLGDLAYAGTFNAGLFGLRVNEHSNRFLQLWADMVVSPGAFYPGLGGQMEQNAFNWLPCFTDDVFVLRDPAYNVAYWNLHDRSVRWRGLDDDPTDAWTVNGRPLVAFHFSGFLPDAPWTLSKHDRRHSLLLLPSIARLCERYAGEVERWGWSGQEKAVYGFDVFPSGVRVDNAMRHFLKEHECSIASDVDPWTDEGEEYYARTMLCPIPHSGSWIPGLFVTIYRSRIDLQAVYPDADLHPENLFRWISEHGIYEYKYEKLFDRWRRVIPNPSGLKKLSEVISRSPELVNGLPAPMGTERQTLLARLEEAGLETLAAEVRAGPLEWYYHSTVAVIRRIWEERNDVRNAFPDPLDTDAERFAAWLGTCGVRENFLPPEAAGVFQDRARGHALARIYSYFSRNFAMMQAWPLGLIGEGTADLSLQLLLTSRHDLEFDAEDVMMLLWTVALKPWAGLALTLELPVNLLRQPPSILPEGQEALLRPLLARDPRIQKALDRYRERYSDAIHRQEEALARRVKNEAATRNVAVVEHLVRRGRPGRSPLMMNERQRRHPGRPGVNLFGFHRSPIGLGNMTRGLHDALKEAGFPVALSPLGNMAMDRDLSPADFVRRWDPALDTNLFVSFPHLQDMLLNTQPTYRVTGRRNIAYLAWEQRDSNPVWADVYREFDQVWALSSFAARSLSHALGRPVLPVPCVLDIESLPEPGKRDDFALPEGRFVFLYIFDANSSVERKNPEAAIRAFARAFKPSEPVTLLVRASNATRMDHRERLARLLGTAAPTHDIRLLTGPLSRRRLMGLISATDCYVSLHRSEGFGYTCAEAMAYRLPVIATGYSGNLDFMDQENSYLVRSREVEVEVPDGPFQRGSVWAEPDEEHASFLMRQVWQNPTEAKVVGERARATVRDRLSVAAVAKVVATALKPSMTTTQRRTDTSDLLTSSTAASLAREKAELNATTSK